MAAFAKAANRRMMMSIIDHPDVRRAFAGLHLRELCIHYSVANRCIMPVRRMAS